MGRHVQAYLAKRRGQAFSLEDKETWWTPTQIRDLLGSVNSTYEQVNARAQQDAEWQPVYTEWHAYYEAQKKRFTGFTVFYGDSDVKEIRRREDLIIDWQRRLGAKGIDTGPLRTAPGEPLSKLIEDLFHLGKVVGLCFVGYQGLQYLRGK